MLSDFDMAFGPEIASLNGLGMLAYLNGEYQSQSIFCKTKQGVLYNSRISCLYFLLNSMDHEMIAETFGKSEDDEKNIKSLEIFESEVSLRINEKAAQDAIANLSKTLNWPKLFSWVLELSCCKECSESK